MARPWTAPRVEELKAALERFREIVKDLGEKKFSP
jgi:hypothetical protein